MEADVNISEHHYLQEEAEDVSEEQDGVPVALSEAFFDDVHGTAKSLNSLKQHSDFGKWLKATCLTPALLSRLERKLEVYRDLRQLDPEGFRSLIDEPSNRLGLQKCYIWQYISHYILNTGLTAFLCINLLLSRSMVVYVIATFGLGGLVSLGLCLFSRSHQTLFERFCGVRLVYEYQSPVELGETVNIQQSPTTKAAVEYSPTKSVVSGVGSKGRPRRKK